MAQELKVNARANEVLAGGATVEITSPDPLDPRSAQAAIALGAVRVLIRPSGVAERRDAATTEQVRANSITEGYGYQWWVTTAGGHAAYAAIGFGGQLIEVVPDLRLVAVFSADITELDAPVDPYSYVSILSLIVQQVEND